MEIKKWKSPQAIIIIAIIVLIFTYIGIDLGMTRPDMRRDIQEIKTEYRDLSAFLNEKIPEIDSTLRIQAEQISVQSQDIDALNNRVQNLSEDSN
jgi:cob(I)alamin adenosyltransferase